MQIAISTSFCSTGLRRFVGSQAKFKVSQQINVPLCGSQISARILGTSKNKGKRKASVSLFPLKKSKSFVRADNNFMRHIESEKPLAATTFL